jgi:hypothetical protein
MTTTWKIANLERETVDGYVYTVHWTLNVTDDEYSAGSYGSIGLERPEDDELIPFEDLTEELVISWICDKMGEEQIETMISALQSQIEEQKAPTKASGVPWNVPWNSMERSREFLETLDI